MSQSTLSLLKRELRDGQLQSLLGNSSLMTSSSNTAPPDPLLSSFIYNSLGPSSLKDSQPQISDPEIVECKKVSKKTVDGYVHHLSILLQNFKIFSKCYLSQTIFLLSELWKNIFNICHYS